MSICKSFSTSLLLALENYAMATDKEQFLTSLPEGLEKNIL